MLVQLPSLIHERKLWQQGLEVAGVDEVGRGCWAGPVVAGAVILPHTSYVPALEPEIVDGVPLPTLLRDSKKLSATQRQTVAEELKKLVVSWSVGQATVEEIDELGIQPATFLAMSRAIEGLSKPVDHLLIDGLPHPAFDRSAQLAMAKADALMASVSAASIVAKVHRDQLMQDLAIQYPEYGLDAHKGYGTLQHSQAIQRLGLTTIHRKSFNIAVA